VGLGVFASVDLATAAILMNAGKSPLAEQNVLQYQVNLVGMGTYLLCTFVWLAYALLPQPAPATATTIPSHELERWNNELEQLLQR
jgi:hypothetical protein